MNAPQIDIRPVGNSELFEKLRSSEERRAALERKIDAMVVTESQRYQNAFGIGFVLGCVMASGFTILFLHFFILP